MQPKHEHRFYFIADSTLLDCIREAGYLCLPEQVGQDIMYRSDLWMGEEPTILGETILYCYGSRVSRLPTKEQAVEELREAGDKWESQLQHLEQQWSAQQQYAPPKPMPLLLLQRILRFLLHTPEGRPKL